MDNTVTLYMCYNLLEKNIYKKKNRIFRFIPY